MVKPHTQPVGQENAKVPDTEIQGMKGGARNRARMKAGIKPAPAGETQVAEDTLHTRAQQPAGSRHVHD